MFKKAESMEDIKKQLANMKLEDKIDLLSDVDVDWDGFFASVLFQKMQNDPNVSEKIKSKLSRGESSFGSQEKSENIEEKSGDSDYGEEFSDEKEEAIDDLNKMIKNENNEDSEDIDEENKNDKEEFKESKSEKPKKEKIIKFKLKKDEFEGNKLNDKKSYNSNLDHDSDEYSVNRDYSVKDGRTSYDPAHPEDYIIDDEDNELNPGNPKGKRNWGENGKKN